jgi:hypothetical protein
LLCRISCFAALTRDASSVHARYILHFARQGLVLHLRHLAGPRVRGPRNFGVVRVILSRSFGLSALL